MDYFEQLKGESGEHSGTNRSTRRAGRPRVVEDIAPPRRLQPRPARRETPAGPDARPAPARIRGRARVSDVMAPPAPVPDEQKPPAREHPPLAPATPPELSIRTWEPEHARRSRKNRRRFLMASAALLLLAIVVPTLAFPRVSVLVIPRAETSTVPQTNLTATTAITAPQPGGALIPAIEMEVSKRLRREYDATGTKFFQERARGTVTISNAYSSSPQSLVAQTRFQDPTGKIFRLSSAVTIPGARIAEGNIIPTSIIAGVLAEEPGANGNIGPTQFRIPGFRGTPKYQGFSAKSDAPFSGGFAGEARVIERADLERASEDLTRAVTHAIGEELEAGVPADQDFLSPNGAREISITRIDQPTVGERADRFPVSVSASGRLFAIRRSQLGGALSALLGLSGANPAVKIAPNQPDLLLAVLGLGPPPGQFRFTVSGKLAYWREAGTAELAAILRGSTPAKAEAYLRGRDEIASFRIRRFPLWLWFVPNRAGGLSITYQQPG